MSNSTRQRTSGLIALELDEGNTLIGAALTDGHSDVLLTASSGKAVRFKESDVRAMGRTARGVRGIRLRGNQKVISLIIPQEDGFVLTASENGFGKRTDVSEFPVKGRGTQGVIAIQVSDRNGDVVGAVQVFAGDELMLISTEGQMIRMPVDQIRVIGRATKGVRLINLDQTDKLVSLAKVAEDEPMVEDDTDLAKVAEGEPVEENGTAEEEEKS